MLDIYYIIQVGSCYVTGAQSSEIHLSKRLNDAKAFPPIVDDKIQQLAELIGGEIKRVREKHSVEITTIDGYKEATAEDIEQLTKILEGDK